MKLPIFVFQLRRELTAKAAGLQFISAKDLRRDTDQQSSSEPDQASDVSEKDSRRPVAYRKVKIMTFLLKLEKKKKRERKKEYERKKERKKSEKEKVRKKERIRE